MSDVPLREYIDVRLCELEKRINQSFTSTAKAVEKAEAAANEKAEAHNGLIRQMQLKEGKFATHTDVENGFKILEERMAAVDNARASREGVERGMSQLWGFIVTGVSALATAIAALAYFKMGS